MIVATEKNLSAGMPVPYHAQSKPGRVVWPLESLACRTKKKDVIRQWAYNICSRGELSNKLGQKFINEVKMTL